MAKKPLPRFDSYGFIYQGRTWGKGPPVNEEDVLLCQHWLSIHARPSYRMSKALSTLGYSEEVANYFNLVKIDAPPGRLHGAFIEAALRLGHRIEPDGPIGAINLALKKPPALRLLNKTFPLHQRPHPDSPFAQALETLEHSAPNDLRFIYANRWQGDIDRIYFGSAALGEVFFLDELGLRLVKASWDEVTRFYSGRWYFHCSLSEFLKVKHRTLSPLLKQFIANLRRGVWVG